jgi:hypothetical protein
LAVADDAEGVTAERAHQENLCRGSAVGAVLAEWAGAAVLWPSKIDWPAAFGDVYPKTTPPLRTDRDTVVVGAANAPLTEPVEIKVHANGPRGPVDLAWTARPQAEGNGQAFLAQVVELARDDGGIMLPTVGSEGLAETGRILESSVDGLTELAERAVATGDLPAARVASQAVLRRDPGNVKAQTVERVIQRREAEAAPAAGSSASDGNDLSLVRTAQNTLPLPPAPTAAGDPAAASSFPAPGALTDQFAGEGALLDRVEEQRRVFAQMLRREVEPGRGHPAVETDAAKRGTRL